MQARLRIENSGANLRSVRLPAELVIGRSADCRLKIASAEVSRKHCRLVLTANGVAVEDLGSSNGTFVDGRQIVPGLLTPLADGAHLLVGPVRFVLEVEKPSKPDLESALEDDLPSSARPQGFSFEDFERENAASSVALSENEGQPRPVPEALTGHLSPSKDAHLDDDDFGSFLDRR